MNAYASTCRRSRAAGSRPPPGRPASSLLISDVPGDDPAVIGCGPTVPDASTWADALAVLERYGIDEPPAAIDHLRAGAAETPKPGDPAFGRDEVVTLATAADALEAAAACARAAGVDPLVLGDDLEGEARDLGGLHAALAPWAAPTAASAPSSPCERRRPAAAPICPGACSPRRSVRACSCPAARQP